MQKCKNAKREGGRRNFALSFLFAALAQNVLNIDSQPKLRISERKAKRQAVAIFYAAGLKIQKMCEKMNFLFARNEEMRYFCVGKTKLN